LRLDSKFKPNDWLDVYSFLIEFCGARASSWRIAFGSAVGGHSSLNKTVTVYNYGGATVSLSKSITGTNASDFAVTDGTCGAMLAGGSAHCT
jgi:hypothetical protein